MLPLCMYTAGPGRAVTLNFLLWYSVYIAAWHRRAWSIQSPSPCCLTLLVAIYIYIAELDMPSLSIVML